MPEYLRSTEAAIEVGRLKRRQPLTANLEIQCIRSHLSAILHLSSQVLKWPICV